MTPFRIRNVVVPAILVASGVFSALTLPFAASQPDSGLPALPTPFWGAEPSLVFDRENRDAATRYVGGAIVISVSAGIITIEILRRLHPSNRLSKAQKDALNSQIRRLESEGQSDPTQLSENVELTISDWLAATEAARLLNAQAEPNRADPIPVSSLLTDVWNDRPPPASASVSASDHLSDRLSQALLDESASREFNSESGVASLSEPGSEAESKVEHQLPDRHTATIALSTKPDLATAPEIPAVQILDQPSETYRVKLPDRHQTLLAILVSGHYYSLTRTHASANKLLALAARLQQQGNRLILTQKEQRYSLWTLQPDAYLELADELGAGKAIGTSRLA